jgi:PAS domain S-box-containing protein
VNDTDKTKGQLVAELAELRQCKAEIEQKYHELFYNPMVGFLRTTLDKGHVLACNDYAAHIFGYESGKVAMAEFVTSKHYANPGDRERIMQKLAAEGKVEHVEVPMIRRDGTPIWASYSAWLYPDKGYLDVVLMDITERKRAEEALQTSEQSLRVIFDTVYDAIFIHDVQGNIIDVNDKMLKMYGLSSKEEALRLSIAEDYSGPHNPLDQLPATWGKVLAGEPQFFEWQARRPHSGEFFEVEVFLRKFNRGGEECVMASVRDITERKRLQQELIDAQQRAIEELSTPIIPLMNDVIILPLIGSIDTRRARNILRSLLDGIDRHQANTVILDITGVSVVDTGVALHLDKTIKAARLKGAEVMITGITNPVAETIVELAIEWDQYQTYRNLETAVGKVITRKEKKDE